MHLIRPPQSVCHASSKARWTASRNATRPFLAVGVTAAALALAGCGVAVQNAAAPTDVPGAAIEGHVHGGVFPIEGATINLMETQSNGYGGNAVQLLTTTSDANGYFTFPNSGYTCTLGQFAYITVTGGYSINLGTTTPNNNVIQVGVIGPCSDIATASAAANVNVFVSELSTVAAAYALGNFISIANASPATGNQIVNISAPPNNNAGTVSPATAANPAGPACTGTGSSMTCTASGLAHAFQNAYTLVDSVRYDGSFPTGQARQYNSLNGYSGVPLEEINTIGNILQSCVDSVGTGSSSCSTLFTDSTPPGGTAPANTLQVAMDMAKYPTNNIASLYALQPQREFFTPDLATAPTSFTISLFYGVTLGGSVVPSPIDIALDAQDNAYILYGPYGSQGSSGYYGAVYGLSASGAQLFTSAKNTSILYPTQIATDTAGHVFVTNNDTNTESNGAIFMANTSNGALKQVATQHNASGLAIDRFNNVWASVANSTDDSVDEYTSSAMTQSFGQAAYSSASPSFYSGAGTFPVTGLAIDGSQNVWGVSAGSSTSNSIALVLPNAGSTTAPSYGTAGYAGYVQGLATKGGFSLTLSSTGEAYFPLSQELDAATYSSSGGFIVNPPSGHGVTTTGSGAPQRSATDGVGNMFWADLEANGLMWEYNPTTGASISFLPCYPFPVGSGYSCITTSNAGNYGDYTPSNLRAMAVDSAGDLWYAADATYGAVIETLGLAAPAWPQLSYGHPGTKPQ